VFIILYDYSFISMTPNLHIYMLVDLMNRQVDV
jgi:hypothetical protein